MNDHHSIALSSGGCLPQIGLGFWKVSKDRCPSVVQEAIDLSCRCFGFGPVVNKLLVSLVFFVFLVYGSVAFAVGTDSSRPNFVLIYADDVGYADLVATETSITKLPTLIA